jgi:hypothetical protein
MNRKSVLLGVAICCLSGIAAIGAGRMQPGLWKFSTSVDMGMAMPQMPPEAMAMMKARGMNVPTPGQAMVSQVCITPEQAAMDRPPQDMQREIGCTMQNAKITATTYSADMVCTGDRMNGKGHTDVTYNGPMHMVIHSTFNGTTAGRPMNTKTDIKADFVSASCGSVKPFAMPKAPGSH